MSRRKDLNFDVSAAERRQLVRLIMDYLTDEVVAAHGMMHINANMTVFEMHRPMLRMLEDHLRANGWNEPLPAWDPGNEIPEEFFVVRQHDPVNLPPSHPPDFGSMSMGDMQLPPDSLPPIPGDRPPLEHRNPSLNEDPYGTPYPTLAVQDKWKIPEVGRRFRTLAALNFDVAPNVRPEPPQPDYPFVFGGWHKEVHDRIGGTMAMLWIAAAAPIFWCFHARVDDIWADWESTNIFGTSDSTSQSELGAAPDVFIRDFAGDNGDPNDSPIGLSPDIILRSSEVADPQAAFGADSDTVDGIPEENVAAGGNKWVYLRVRNRGGTDAVDVPAVVFWSPMSTFLSPDDWHPLGGVVLPNVPAGNILTVSDGIEWFPELGFPRDGRVALIAWANLVPDDPLFPFQESFTGLEHLQNYIRANNNIAVRSYQIVPYDPRPWGELPWDVVSLPFVAAGPWDRARTMHLEVHAHLPEGSQVLLKAPHGLLTVLGARSRFSERTASGNHGHVPCSIRGRHVVGHGAWPARGKYPSRLLVHIPKALAKSAYYEIFARQMHEGKEVGRSTWRIVAPNAKTASRVKRG